MIWLRTLLCALTAVMTLGTPAQESERPRQGAQEFRMKVQMARTEDVRECIRLGTLLEQAAIDLERFELTTEGVGGIYGEMLGTQQLPWYVRLDWSYWCGGRATVQYLAPRYLDPAVYDRSRYEKAAAEVLEETVHPGMSQMQIALSIHDYLAIHCAYDESLERYTAYDALVRDSAVCQGYAEAYMDLLRRAGIECIVVSSEEMNHAWNQVKLDGRWYNVDLTWNDPAPNREGMAGHSFFLVSDAQMASPEYGYYGWTSPNECTDTTYDQGAFWADVISPVVYEDADTCYLIRVREKDYQILRRDETTGTEEQLALVDFKYPQFLAVGGRWAHFYTGGLSKVGDALYYTDINGLRRLDLISGDVTTAYSHDISKTDQALVGSFLEDGTLYLTTIDREQELHSFQVPYDGE